ncbi:hypothetical protein DPV78_010695 [Talaromyces pinophilus]|nr:hypothetical protein DPV78_010695 [Talaromyces pinophilus]
MDKALEPVQNILEVLTLGVHCKWNEGEGVGEEVLLPDVRGVIRSLANFTQLTNLKIYYRYLIDRDSEEPTELVELLPPTLQVLTLTGTNSSNCRFDRDLYGDEQINYELLYDLLRQYVNRKATHAPYLRSLNVIVCPDFNKHPMLKNALNRLQRATVWARIVFNTNQGWQYWNDNSFQF